VRTPVSIKGNVGSGASNKKQMIITKHQPQLLMKYSSAKQNKDIANSRYEINDNIEAEEQ
jgi:hypothetical protein